MKALRCWLAIATLALALAACGGDDETDTTTDASATPTVDESSSPDGASEEPQEGQDGDSASQALTVPDVAELVLTSSNPEDACVPPHVTEAYVKASYGSASGCSQALAEGGPIADSVEVGSVDESGDTAATVAVAVGGVYDGEEIELELVRQGENWSVDGLKVDVPAGP